LVPLAICLLIFYFFAKVAIYNNIKRFWGQIVFEFVEKKRYIMTHCHEVSNLMNSGDKDD